MIQLNFNPLNLLHPIDNIKNKLQEENHLCLNSESMIECQEDQVAQVVALQAPVVKINALLCARNKLAIFTDLLIISGGYISKPAQWHIEAKDVVIQNADQNATWITSLIHEQGGKKAIYSSTFDAKTDGECNFKRALPQKAVDTFNEVKDKIKAFKDLVSNLRPTDS